MTKELTSSAAEAYVIHEQGDHHLIPGFIGRTGVTGSEGLSYQDKPLSPDPAEAEGSAEADRRMNLEHVVMVPCHAELRNGNLTRLLLSARNQGVQVKFLFLLNDRAQSDDRAIEENALTAKVFDCIRNNDRAGFVSLQERLAASDGAGREALMRLMPLAEDPRVVVDYIERHDLSDRLHFGNLRTELLEHALSNLSPDRRENTIFYLSDADVRFSPGYFRKHAKVYADPTIQTVFSGYDLYPALYAREHDGQSIEQTRRDRMVGLDYHTVKHAYAASSLLVGGEPVLFAETPQISLTAASVTPEIMDILRGHATSEDYATASHLFKHTHVGSLYAEAFVHAAHREQAARARFANGGFENNAAAAINLALKLEKDHVSRHNAMVKLSDRLHGRLTADWSHRMLAHINSTAESRNALAMYQSALARGRLVDDVLVPNDRLKGYRAAIREAFEAMRQSGENSTDDRSYTDTQQRLMGIALSLYSLDEIDNLRLLRQVDAYLAYVDHADPHEASTYRRSITDSVTAHLEAMVLDALHQDDQGLFHLDVELLERSAQPFMWRVESVLQSLVAEMDHEPYHEWVLSSKDQMLMLQSIKDNNRFNSLLESAVKLIKREKAKRVRLLGAYVSGNAGDRRLGVIADILPIFEEAFPDQVRDINVRRQNGESTEQIVDAIANDRRYRNLFQFTRFDSDKAFVMAYQQCRVQELQAQDARDSIGVWSRSN